MTCSLKPVLDSHDSRGLGIGAFVLALGMYIVAYYLAVRPGGAVWFTSTGRKIYTLPSYGGLSPSLFAPIHYLDRTVIRPKYWGPSRVWTLTSQTPVTGNQTTFTNITGNVITGTASH